MHRFKLTGAVALAMCTAMISTTAGATTIGDPGGGGKVALTTTMTSNANQGAIGATKLGDRIDAGAMITTADQGAARTTADFGGS